MPTTRTRWCYRWILLDNLVHEFNALRGVLGEPTEVRSADLGAHCVSVNLRFGDTECHLSWVDLPGIARYKQGFAFYAPDERLTLALPSPFLRSMPSRLIVEGGEPGTAHSWAREEIVSYDEAFKRELCEFADCIATGRSPAYSGADGLADVGYARRWPALTRASTRNWSRRQRRRRIGGHEPRLQEGPTGGTSIDAYDAGHGERRRRRPRARRCRGGQCAGQLRGVRDHGRRGPERARLR